MYNKTNVIKNENYNTEKVHPQKKKKINKNVNKNNSKKKFKNEKPPKIKTIVIKINNKISRNKINIKNKNNKTHK